MSNSEYPGSGGGVRIQSSCHVVLRTAILFVFMQVKQVEHTMDEWSHSVDRLLLKHHWLLLFSLPKLLRLSKLLRCAFQTDDGAVEVMQEICFLFCNDMKSREKVLDAIKVIVIALYCIWQIVFYCFILSFCRTH